MKRVLSFCAVATILLFVTSTVTAQTSQVAQGTQVRLTVVNGVSSSIAHDGDPITAVVAEPVFVGSQLVLPAGTKVHGQVTNVTRPKLFSMIRGGASMNVTFKSVEIDSRIFPAQMSILGLYSGGTELGKERKDLKTVEGAVIEEKHDVKTDIIDVGLGTSGGSLVGLIFSHVLRGTMIGLVGSSVYIVAKKGKDVELPAQTGMIVRLDSTVAFPTTLMHNATYTSGDK
jgi:hypothetical protein